MESSAPEHFEIIRAVRSMGNDPAVGMTHVPFLPCGEFRKTAPGCPLSSQCLSHRNPGSHQQEAGSRAALDFPSYSRTFWFCGRRSSEKDVEGGTREKKAALGGGETFPPQVMTQPHEEKGLFQGCACVCARVNFFFSDYPDNTYSL